MKLNDSLDILQITEEDLLNYDVFVLKKQYHKRALDLHPDKGGNNNDFQNLHEAYSNLNELLLLRIKSTPLDTLDASKYIEYFKFLMNNDDLKSYVYGKLIIIIKDLINEFKRQYLSSLMKTNKSKTVVELTPSIEDLKLNNIYKYNYLDTYFLIPLWHGDVYFEYDNTEIIFICNPTLPNGYYIDEYNCMHIMKQYNLHDISQEKELIINEFYDLRIPVEELKIKHKQTYKFVGGGLTAINVQNIYDISKRMDVIVHIDLIY
jgi:hypothetical protein